MSSRVTVLLLPLCLFAMGQSPCGGSGPTGPLPPDAPPPFVVDVSGAVPRARVDDRFVSFTVDIDRLIRGNAHLERPEVRALARALAPAMMRIGGSKADTVYYDLGDAPVAEAPLPYRDVLHRAQWDAACDFAAEVGVEIAFTLNAGEGPRDADGLWTDDAARAFIEYSRARGCPVTVWELGNEVSSWFADTNVGMDLDAAEYAHDFATARALLDEVDPDARLAGPASAYWPRYGEATLTTGFLPDFVASAARGIDVVTWHYYPTESDAAPADVPAPRPARVEILLDPDTLDEVLTWADEVEGAAATDAPDAEVWLGETASAQWGGQEGLSDRFAAGLWWVDQLGLLALRGENVVARQSLTGGRYHLLDADDETGPVVAFPDYYNSALWRRLMGGVVLEASAARAADPDAEAADAGTAFDPSRLRVYAHCTPGRPGAVTVLAVNLDEAAAVPLAFAGLGEVREVYRLTATDPLGTEVRLNGLPLAADPDGAFPDVTAWSTQDPIELPARAYAFVVLGDAHAPACE